MFLFSIVVGFIFFFYFLEFGFVNLTVFLVFGFGGECGFFTIVV